MSYSLTIHNQGLIRAMEQGPNALQKHMSLAVLRSVKEMARDAKRNAPKAFSTLTNSINHRMLTPLVGEVVAGVDYARMVEEGTGPGGFPGVQTMEDWIKVKGIQPNDPGMDVRDLAYVMARSIAIHGTPAQPFMEPAYKSNKAKAERRCNHAIDAALKEMH